MDKDFKILVEAAVDVFVKTIDHKCINEFRVYNNELCSDLWDENQMLYSTIRDTLLKTAYEFYETSKLPAPIVDVYLMGSIANFNWTPNSDADIHILIDYNQLQMPDETAKKVVKTISSQWNTEHDIVVKNHKIEINFQSSAEEKPHVTGIYSLVKNQWIRKPSKININIDKTQIQAKYKEFKTLIQSVIDAGNIDKMKEVKEYLDTFRQSGLDNKGELSNENIVFKLLRSKGLLKRLKEAIVDTYDNNMSIKEKCGKVDEGVGAGKPEQDRLHIPDHRWQIKSKDAPKTPKLDEETNKNI